MLAAARERRIDKLVLLGTPASTGPELIMEQQRAALENLGTPDSERSEQIDLQRRINAAVLGNGPWDSIPPRLRRRAETIWYRSFLQFDVADTVRRTRQPILILHGDENRQIAVEHADRLLLLARQRRRNPPTEKIVLEGLDHAFMDAEPPMADDNLEYRELQEASISLDLPTALGNWLRSNQN
jgi:pimeloyl-ACP methyl ester carboxylesterase